MGYLLYENMSITDEGVALMIIDKDIATKYDIRDGETEGFVNLALAIDRVKMSIFLKQDDGGFSASQSVPKRNLREQVRDEIFPRGWP